MTTPGFGSYDEVRTRVHAQADESRRRTQALREVSAQVRTTTGTATSADGSLTVTAAVGGAVTGLTLRDRALELGADRLAAELRTAIAAAQRAAVTRAAQAAADELGPDHPLVVQLQGTADQFGGPGLAAGR